MLKMSTNEEIYRLDSLLKDASPSTQLNKNQSRMSGAPSFDDAKDNVANIYSPQRHIDPFLSSVRNHRNGFSRSMVDLSSSRSLNRKSVMFEEDLFAQKEIIQRARNRFKELELKYPEIFKNSRTPSVLSSRLSRQSVSFDRPESPELKSVERKEIQTAKTDTSQVEISGEDSRAAVTISKRKPPPLSAAMKLHYLEDSCDSAFDEIDHDRESLHSKTSREPTPPTFGHSKQFLYPGESVESDKDSGISTDRSHTPHWRPAETERCLDLGLSEKHCLPLKSKSMTALSSPRRNSLDYRGINFDTKRQREDRRGILKSVAYRNQEIKADSLDIPESASYCQARQNRSGSVLSANIRRGSSIYRRSIFSDSSSCGGSQDEPDSDAETIYSVQSEFILRPHMSARERYFSTYQLKPITETDPRDVMVNHKWRSMPELPRNSSFGNDGLSFRNSLQGGFDEKKKKKKRKFGRRSGLYIVNDVPISEKPRLTTNKGKRRSKIFSKKAKKSSLHVNESTKKWFDSQTAVSRPTGGQSLGKIVAMREDLGGAYVLELQRSPGGLFGFFIQKGYKQYKGGVFVSRIMDCSASKFMAGLLNPGDEILEINGESTISQTMSEVHNVLANSDKLFLTVLPILGRKDW